jgi:hypothetical protein
MSIQLIFRNPFTPVELIDAGFNLCVNHRSIFQKPAILFFLSLHHVEQDLLDAKEIADQLQETPSGVILVWLLERAAPAFLAIYAFAAGLQD